MMHGVAPFWRWLVGLLILAAFVVWTEQAVGWRAIVQSWACLDPGSLLVTLVLLATSYLARAERIVHAFPGANRAASLRIVLIHTASNNFLPVRSGELAFPVFMKRVFGVPTAVSVPRLLWFRVLDAVALFGVAALVVAWRLLGGAIAAVAMAGVVVIGGTALGLVYRLRTPLLLRLERTTGRLTDALRRLIEGIPAEVVVRRRLEIWTLAVWLIKLAGFVVLLSRFGGLNPESALLGAVGGELSSVLPVHGLAGAGTYEAGVLVVLRPLQVAMDAALPAAVTLHLFILGASAVGLVPALLPLPCWRRPEES